MTEDLPLEPLTDYSKYKAMCEDVLLDEARARLRHADPAPGHGLRLFAPAAAGPDGEHPDRPRRATGRSRSSAARRCAPTSTSRTWPRLYLRSLAGPTRPSTARSTTSATRTTGCGDRRDGPRASWARTWQVVTTPTDDLRSYHVSSAKIRRELGFAARHTVEDAVRDLVAAFRGGQDPQPDDRHPLLQHQAHASRRGLR